MLAQILHEADAVGVVAGKPAVFRYRYRVAGADELGCGRNVVDEPG